MAISRHATAHWEGDLKSGQGRLSTPESGLMQETPYGFGTRFGDRRGVNPEELIAAAHAGCFTMALSAKLAEAGHADAAIDTRAEVELSMDGGPTICAIRLTTTVRAEGLDAARLRALADDAGKHCPVSRALSAVPIHVAAELAQG